MRYFSYDEPDPFGPGGIIVTVSEDEIREEFYPYWYEKMCAKYGKEHVDETYSFEDCLDDWVVVHWAWEVKDR